MRYRYSTLLALFVIFCAKNAHAGAGSEAASFLDIPVGGRPAAMGDAYSALADDAYATTANPGGLGFLDHTEIAGQHLAYLDSIHYEDLSIAYPFHQGSAIGLSAQYLGSGNITQTDPTGASIGTFSTYFASYGLSYAHSIGDKLSLGLTGKVIDASIAGVTASAYAGDAGALYQVNEKLSLAAVATNIGTKLTFLSDGGTLPQAYTLGAAYKPNSHYTFSADGVYNGTGLIDGHFGAEWKPIQMIAIRAGYRTDTTKELGAMAGVSTGLGLQLWGQELAYAWVPYGDLGNTQYFSILIRFGQAEEAKRNLIQYQDIKRNRSAQNQDNIEHADPEYQQLMQLLSDEDRELVTQKPVPGAAQ